MFTHSPACVEGNYGHIAGLGVSDFVVVYFKLHLRIPLTASIQHLERRLTVASPGGVAVN